MRINEILCTNSKGDSLLISQKGIFRLQEDIDLTGAKVNVSYTSNFKTHGETAISSKLEKRNLSLLFFIDVENQPLDWIQVQRDRVFKVFNPIYNPIRIDIKTEMRNVFIEANVESTPSMPPGVESVNDYWHDVLVQFSAGNPFFQDVTQQKVEIAVWEPLFEFPLEIPIEGIEVGRRSPSLIVNVLNNGQVPTGMVIQFRALGTVTNPSLFNVITRQFIKINKVLTAGEIITVNTIQGKKKIESTLNGVTTNIFNKVEFGSKFMQLEVGDNVFRYDADNNINNLETSIYFTPQYIGV